MTWNPSAEMSIIWVMLVSDSMAERDHSVPPLTSFPDISGNSTMFWKSSSIEIFLPVLTGKNRFPGNKLISFV
jgi:hypothetical protein